MQVPHPVHFDASKAGERVRPSMYMAPVGQALVTGQYGFPSQASSSNTTGVVIGTPDA